MKTTFKFGAAAACVGAIVTLISYFLGFQNDPDKFIMGSIVAMIAGIGLTVVFMVKGTRAVRNETDLIDGFKYGQAFKACFQVGLFGVLIGAVFNFVYFSFINPDFSEAAIGWTTNFMENAGVPADQLDEQIAKMNADANPIKGTTNGLIGGFVFTIILSLITAAFLRKPPSDDLESEVAPPPLS